MRKILFALFGLILLVSCRTKTVTIERLDLSKISQIDSTYSEVCSYSGVSFLDQYLQMHDSIITHITIVRYDTARNESGEQMIVETIDIESIQIHSEEEKKQSGDSIRSVLENTITVAKKDSLQVEQMSLEVEKNRSKFFHVLIVVLLLVVIAAVMVVIAKKQKR